MNSRQKTGVLLVNLGTPKSPDPTDVYRYLIEFLTDPRVIDYPWWARQLLVRGLIVPLRYRNSARQYQKIWTGEGSPLMVYGRKVKTQLQQSLGPDFIVSLAMRYQGPTIESAIKELLDQQVTHLIVIPLFPQYASATSGSVHQQVMEVLSKEQAMPKVTLVEDYATHPAFVDAWAKVAQSYTLSEYDYYLFSFHGLPERQIRKADRANVCLRIDSCCAERRIENHGCYRAQCYATAREIARKLELPDERWSVCFQSRLGREKWLEPYAEAEIRRLAQHGVKRLLFFSPSFVCDCLETLFEADVEYAEKFVEHGGERFQLVESLNDNTAWIAALQQIVFDQVGIDDETAVESKMQPMWN